MRIVVLSWKAVEGSDGQHGAAQGGCVLKCVVSICMYNGTFRIQCGIM